VFTRIRVGGDRIEVVDRAALLLQLFTGTVAVGMGAALVATARAQFGTGRWIGTALTALAFAASALFAALAWRLRSTRAVFDAADGVARFRRRRAFRVERRTLPLADIAEVVLRERRDDDGGFLRGVHVVTRAGERIDVVAADQTDGDRFAPLVDAIRAMVARPPRGAPR
jgi:hypothetical protein